MTYAFLIFTAIVLVGCMGPGQVSELGLADPRQFPQVKGEDLTGAPQWLPVAFHGKVNVVAVGFERSHQSMIEKWHATLQPILGENPEAQFYEVPVIYEMNGVARFWLNNAMALYVSDRQAKKHTVIVYTNREQFAKHLDVSVQDPVLLILDDNDHVVWKSSGTISQLEYIKVRGILKGLLKNETAV
jgi:hypothetical protein